MIGDSGRLLQYFCDREYKDFCSALTDPSLYDIYFIVGPRYVFLKR